MHLKKLVILDIDHTLIHAMSKRDAKQKEAFIVAIMNNKYYVHKRNHLRQFINGLRTLLSKDFKVAIWTAAHRDYAVQIIDNIWPEWRNELLFLRSNTHCSTLPSGDVVKDMIKLPQGYDTILVDDHPLNYTINTANNFSVWKISPFTHASVDSELLQVLNYIKSYSHVPFSIRPKTPCILRTKPITPHTKIRVRPQIM
jgi:TFIIF-interacting CTD phosphatase-like protein